MKRVYCVFVLSLELKSEESSSYQSFYLFTNRCASELFQNSIKIHIKIIIKAAVLMIILIFF